MDGDVVKVSHLLWLKLNKRKEGALVFWGHPLYGVVWCCVVELTVSFSEMGFCLGGDVVSAMLVAWVSGWGIGNRR